jgi:hypothetical protein
MSRAEKNKKYIFVWACTIAFGFAYYYFRSRERGRRANEQQGEETMANKIIRVTIYLDAEDHDTPEKVAHGIQSNLRRLLKECQHDIDLREVDEFGIRHCLSGCGIGQNIDIERVHTRCEVT